MFKRILVGIGAVILVMAVVIAVNTWRYQPQPRNWEKVDLPAIDVLPLAEKLQQAIRFQTISKTENTQTPPVAFTGFVTWLDQAFPKATAVMERELINGLTPLYRWEGRNTTQKPILLAAHYDVVPVEDEGGNRWTHPPFDGVIDDVFVWGRGAMDDKGFSGRTG